MVLTAMTSAPSSLGVVDRLPFVLPHFARHSWVGERARIIWEPRIERICQAWADVEWLSVFEGVRDCALVGLSEEGILESCAAVDGASILSASSLPLTGLPAYPGLTFIVVGGLAAINQARRLGRSR